MLGPTVGLLVLLCAAACVTTPSEPRHWDFSGELPESDVFMPGVRTWQAAAEGERRRDRVVSEDASMLAEAYTAFSRELRRQLAGDVLKFVQTSSGLYFRPDGSLDYWPTFNEVLESGGDDCDGMDVLTFRLLRSSGFGPGEVYRVILYSEERDLHHMATLWFEEGREHGRVGDPWVLDPTGEVSSRMRRLSELDWEPKIIFDETQRYRVVPAGARGVGAGKAGY